MMKTRMRELNIKLTELSEYLKVSRPTLYKYIESYESGDLESIPDNVVSIFRLMEREDVTKEQVVTFAITAFSEGGELDDREIIKRYLADPSASKAKVEMMYRLATSDCMDDMVPYLNGCMEVLSGNGIDDDQVYQVARFVLMRSKVLRGIPLKEDELREAEKLLEGSHGH